MNAGIVIKRLAADDADLYRALMLRAYSEHDAAFTSTFEERANKPIEWWTKRLLDPTSITIGAFDKELDALIGSVRLEAYQRTRERHKVQLTAMYVMKGYAGQGVGRCLLDEALTESRGLNSIELINLTVTENNLAAVRLYAKLGFQTFGREARAVKTSTGYLDKLHMWRSVSADYLAQG